MNRSFQMMSTVWCGIILLSITSLLSIVSAAKDPSLLPAGMPTTLKFGSMGALLNKADGVTPNPDARALGQPALAGYLLALAEINNSTEWLPGTTIEGLFSDTKSDGSTMIFESYNLATQGIIAAIGDVMSIGTQTQEVLKHFSIPQIAPNSYLADYSTNHALYPYFMRTCITVPGIMTELARLIYALGYKRTGLLYSTDTYLQGAFVPFQSACASMGIELPVISVYIAGEKDWSSYIDRIVNGGVRVITWMGNPTDLTSLWRYAATQTGDRNIIGAGYIWILNHSMAASYMYTDTKGNLIPDMVQMYAGQVGFLLHSEAGSAAKKNFDTLWSQMQPHPNLTLVDFTQPAGTTAQFAYDATWLAARGLHRMIHEMKIDPRPLANRPLLYETIRNVTFQGSTGTIKLDINGDRQLYFDVANFKRSLSKFVSVGYMGESHKIDMLDGASFEWPGGDGTMKPADRPARGLTVISSSVKTGVIATCIVVLVLCVIMQILAVGWRGHNVMKASSPLFLFIYLVGVQLLCASVIPRALESDVSTSPQPCNADLFLANIGYTLLIGSLLVKTIRLQHIFNRTKLHTTLVLTDTKLIMGLSAFVVLETVLLLGLALGAPMSIQLKELRTMEDYYLCRTNSSTDQLINIYLPVVMTTRFAFLLATTVFVYRVRNIPSAYNESRQLGIVCYNLLFLSILLPAIEGTLGRGLDAPLIAYSSCVFLICVASVLIVFMPKIYNLFIRVHLANNNNSSNMSAPTKSSEFVGSLSDSAKRPATPSPAQQSNSPASIGNSGTQVKTASGGSGSAGYLKPVGDGTRRPSTSSTRVPMFGNPQHRPSVSAIEPPTPNPAAASAQQPGGDETPAGTTSAAIQPIHSAVDEEGAEDVQQHQHQEQAAEPIVPMQIQVTMS